MATHVRHTAVVWAADNPTLASGQVGLETDTLRTKVGDGSTAWNSLAYSPPDGATSGGSEIGYDQRTTNVTVASTTEATPTTIISCAAHSFDGSAVLLEFFSPLVNAQSPSGSHFVKIGLYEGGTQISRIFVTTQALQISAIGRYRFTPTAGNHTYVIGGFSDAGGGIVGAGAGGVATDPPTFVRFTKA